ncbi:MAG: hypothetical protein AAF696_31685 [Bacteroidota bacterium]
MIENRDLIQLLESSDLDMAKECITCLQSGDSELIYKDWILDTEKQLLVLSRRTENGISEKVKGLEAVIEGLKKYQGTNFRVVEIANTDSTYIIYLSENLTELIGLWQSFNINKDKWEKLRSSYKKLGFDD